MNERTCCSFFQFELVFELNEGPIWLRLRGAENVKAFIRAKLNAGDANSTEARSMTRQKEQEEDNVTYAETIESAARLPDREAIRAELEATRRAYHELVNSISADGWNGKGGNSRWRVGQLLWHLAWGAGYFPRGVEECRRGKATNPPRWIMNPLNMLITRIGSRRATPQSVLHKYDDAHAAIRRLPRWSPGRRMEQGSEASWCIRGIQDDRDRLP